MPALHRVPSTDVNANPVEWPVAPRYIGERSHSPYDQYHENPDRYMPPLDLMSWRQQQRARRTAIWPTKIQFPQMPAPGDTYNQMVEVETKVSRAAAKTQAQATAELQMEVQAEKVEAAAEAEAQAEAVAQAEAEAEAEAESEMTPKEMYWYWVQPEIGRDRFGRDAPLFTPSHPKHAMFKFGAAAAAATGHSRLHVAAASPPLSSYTKIGAVKHQTSKEPFEIAAALNVAVRFSLSLTLTHHYTLTHMIGVALS
jgi:hypothetical protein